MVLLQDHRLKDNTILAMGDQNLKSARKAIDGIEDMPMPDANGDNLKIFIEGLFEVTGIAD